MKEVFEHKRILFYQMRTELLKCIECRVGCVNYFFLA
jgi:hypothetical protein